MSTRLTQMLVFTPKADPKIVRVLSYNRASGKGAEDEEEQIYGAVDNLCFALRQTGYRRSALQVAE